MLKVRIRPIPRRLPKAEGRKPDGHGTGPTGRINKMRKLVTGLLRHERLEGNYYYMDEARGYAERVIQEASKHGDRHKPTMEMLDYWILEKDLIHKLFKVIVPRYSNYATAATSIYRLPTEYPGGGKPLAVLELRGNPWPPVVPHTTDNTGTLVNVLLDAAKREYREEKYRAMVSNSIDNDDSSSFPPDQPHTASEMTDDRDNSTAKSDADGKVLASSDREKVVDSSILSAVQQLNLGVKENLNQVDRVESEGSNTDRTNFQVT